MAKDIFETAGEEFREETAKKNAARKKASELLPEIADFCKQGIEKFYGGKNNYAFVDVDVNRVLVSCGSRPGKKLSQTEVQVLESPSLFIVVGGSGELRWCIQQGWVREGYSRETMKATDFDAANYKEIITPLLIEFLKATEDEYRVHRGA